MKRKGAKRKKMPKGRKKAKIDKIFDQYFELLDDMEREKRLMNDARK